jgi:hypothetical protein
MTLGQDEARVILNEATLLMQMARSDAWRLVEMRLKLAIEAKQERMLDPLATHNDLVAARERILAYRELLALPSDLEEQSHEAKQALSSESE